MRGWIVMLVFIAGTVAAIDGWAQEIPAERVEASTGDVLKLSVDGERQVVALWGVSAPSVLTRQGLAARTYVSDFLRAGDPRVELVNTKAGVRYVRVIIDGAVLNEALLREGHARWDRTFSPDETAYKALEVEARSRGVGMWRKVDRVLPPLRIEVSRNGTTSSILIDSDGNRAVQAKGSVKADPRVANAALQRAAEARALRRAQEAERARRQAEYVAMQAAAARRSYDESLARYSRELAVQRQENAMYGWQWYPYQPWYGYRPWAFRWIHSAPVFVSHSVVMNPKDGNRGV